MAVVAEFITSGGAHVRIMDDLMDKTPGAHERMMQNFWDVVHRGLKQQLDAGVPYEELKERIRRAKEEADEEMKKPIKVIVPWDNIRGAYELIGEEGEDKQ